MHLAMRSVYLGKSGIRSGSDTRSPIGKSAIMGRPRMIGPIDADAVWQMKCSCTMER
jgi:hypothetical protein